MPFKLAYQDVAVSKDLLTQPKEKIRHELMRPNQKQYKREFRITA